MNLNVDIFTEWGFKLIQSSYLMFQLVHLSIREIMRDRDYYKETRTIIKKQNIFIAEYSFIKTTVPLHARIDLVLATVPEENLRGGL